MDTMQQYVGDVWSSRYTQKNDCCERIHWGHSKKIVQHVTQLICKEPKDTISSAIQCVIKNNCQNIPFNRAISVGCGIGNKEMTLIENGIVHHFDLYELSEEAIFLGKAEAEKRGITENVSFHLGDAFEKVNRQGYYNFIYWDNALHHMPDADYAISWSKNILAENGYFFMFDFVGPSRFQWSDAQMRILKDILESIDDMYFIIPGSEFMWKKEAKRSTLEEIMRDDPSEAADSDNIIPAFNKYFPSGTLIPLGGLVYTLGLDGIIVNIPDDSLLLNKLLKIDTILSKQSHNYFAVGHAFK